MEGSSTQPTINTPSSGNLAGGSLSSSTPATPSLPAHSSSQRSSNILDEEESPLLSSAALETTTTTSGITSTTTSPFPDLLDALQNRDATTTTTTTCTTRSQDVTHLPQHLYALERKNSSAVTPASPSIPEPFPFSHKMEETRRISSEGSVVALSLSSATFLSPQNSQPTAPPVYESSSSRPCASSRRRLVSSSRHQQRSVPVSTTTTTTSHSNLLPRVPNTNNDNSAENDNNNDNNNNDTSTSTQRRRQRNNNNNSLRASLDAGMAAVQRRVRARSATTSSAASSASEPSSGRSVTWSNNHRESSSISEVVSLSSRSAGINNNNNTAATTSSSPDEESNAGPRSLSHVYNGNHPTTIFEEDEDALGRQRALSESDAVRIRDIFRSMGARRRRGRGRRGTENNNARQLSSSAAAALHTTTTTTTPTAEDNRPITTTPSPAVSSTPGVPPPDFLFASPPGAPFSSLRERSVTDGGLDSFRYNMEPLEMTGPPVAMGDTSSVSSEHSQGTEGDTESRARARWMQINRRFQFVITAVALLFSLLLFAILICWVVMTSAYVVSFDKPCDVPLKPYFWLVTFQLVLDVFRTDIMRFVFDWDSSSNQRIPTRVILYNVMYLIYALMVLRLGIRSVFVDEDAECRETAPELFNASVAFVSLSLAAWGTIICGYLLPFFVVAALLTCNGYNPSSSAGATQPVFPSAYANTGAPPGTIDLLHELRIEDFPEDYPRECCICMEPFGRKPAVETSCKHVFHKQCCREWLRQARSCPVCRMDIPSACHERSGHSTNNNTEASDGVNGTEAPQETPRIPIGPTGRPVVGLWRVLRRQPISIGSGSESRGEGE